MIYHEIQREMISGTAHRALPDWAYGLLDDIATGRSPIRAVRHPLGFVCLPVERRGDHGVCVHIWPADLPVTTTTTSQVHCHSWDLLSYVLYGEMHNEISAVHDAATSDATWRVFEVVSTGDTDEIRPTARTVRHTAVATETHTAGATYTLPAGIFHRSLVSPGQATATVVLGRTHPGASDLSLGPLAGAAHRVTRERFGPADTARAARVAAGHLGRAETPG